MLKTQKDQTTAKSDNPKEIIPGDYKKTTRFTYHDPEGKPAHRTIKIDHFENGKRTKKRYYQEHRSNGKWEKGLKEGDKTYLYHLPAWLTAMQDWQPIVEGEKDVRTFERLDFVATCNPMGAGKWKSDYNQYCKGRLIAIFCDRDKLDTKTGKITGEEHGRSIARSIYNVAAKVKLIFMPADLPDAKDVTELVEKYGWITKDFLALIDKTPVFIPKEIGSRLIVKRLSDVEPVPVQWLWFPRFAQGKVSLLVGNPGVGKSFASLDIVSRISTGALWPDGDNLPDGSNCAQKGSSLLLTAEDGLDDTVRPRLDRMGADCSRIFAIQGSFWESEKESTDFPAEDEVCRPEFFNLLRDVDLLENKSGRSAMSGS